MSGHCILSHGMESGPHATKVSALAKAAESLGWTSERPDYCDLDATHDVREVHTRLARLSARCAMVEKPLVLAGSSMGAFISALATLETRCVGLFLIAPPIELPDFPLLLDAAHIPTCIIHGWEDELIPATDVVRWAQPRGDRLILVNDSHRLTDHVDYCAEVFGRFLANL